MFITNTSSLLQVTPSQFLALVLSSLRLLTSWNSPLSSRRLVPAVPYRSPNQNHASYTPVAICPVTKLPTDLSQVMETPLVLTTCLWITTRQQKFRSIRLSDPYLPEYCSALSLECSLPHLFNAAASSGLKPAFGSRLRRAYLHLL
jgi:hypothetical protein